MSEAHAKVVEGKPSMLVFAHSSGYPIYRMFKAISSAKDSRMPPMCILPLSSHNFGDSSKKDIAENFKEVRQNTFSYSAKTIKRMLEGSVNPNSPIMLVDEVLSGSCVVGIRNSLKAWLEPVGVKNEIKVIGISSQKHLMFKKSILECASSLIERGMAFINHDSARQSHGLTYEDLQLTPEGLKGLLFDGIATFKSLGFRRLVNKDVAYAIPVIDLFTSDNFKYNPLLVLNKEEMRLEARPQSYDSKVLSSTSALAYQVGILESK
ncbi:MAG: hypothetical protein NTX79_07780 [Candidatus Micrarchaeota archaeon]|nr:hypothetical protein [Candidatus Micrarchaeota archaeon]